MGLNTSRLFLHATNVHEGGGRILLEALLRSLSCSTETYLLLDSRMQLPDDLSEGVSVKQVRPTVAERFKAERWLSRNVAPGDIAICFGNLPPLYKLRGRVVVFLQNRYLIENSLLDSFGLKCRVRLTVERFWLSHRIVNADLFVVQTPTMQSMLKAAIHEKVPVQVTPFVMEPSSYSRDAVKEGVERGRSLEFLYVASGEPHKNHLRMIEAWCLLATEGLFPVLRLTLDEARFFTLCREIREMSSYYALKVTNMGSLSHGDVLKLYRQVGALIYPSLFESFGLPLIEARQAGLPVLASELDYVRDLIDPEQSFDPHSPTSIARAVKRFIGIDERLLPVLDARGFLDEIIRNNG